MRFLSLWTGKEAVVKTLGLSLPAEMKEINGLYDISGSEWKRIECYRDVPLYARSIDIDSAYVCTLCVRNEPSEVRIIDYTY